VTQLYKVSGESLVPVARGQLANEGMIEAWVARQPELLGLEILIIGRQVQTDFGGRIDLLGLDADGGLVIFELKVIALRAKLSPGCSTTPAGPRLLRHRRYTTSRKAISVGSWKRHFASADLYLTRTFRCCPNHCCPRFI
jgi:hypothetical protein